MTDPEAVAPVAPPPDSGRPRLTPEEMLAAVELANLQLVIEHPEIAERMAEETERGMTSDEKIANRRRFRELTHALARLVTRARSDLRRVRPRPQLRRHARQRSRRVRRASARSPGRRSEPDPLAPRGVS